MININVGVLGHVDSGKTSLCKCLSEILSTCALDKHKESKERGITIDLGFSSFYIKKKIKYNYNVNHKKEIETNLQNYQENDKNDLLFYKREEKYESHNIEYDNMINIDSNEEYKNSENTNLNYDTNNIYFYDEEIIQICLVDCPGHYSLLKTIIMGSEITDIILLVIDINKGIQKQTIECLVLCKIINSDIIIVLNKIDLIPLHLREKKINSMKKKIQQAFYKFKSLQKLKYHIVSISAYVKGKDNKGDQEKKLSDDNMEGKNKTLSDDNMEGKNKTLSDDNMEGKNKTLSDDNMEGKNKTLSDDNMEDQKQTLSDDNMKENVNTLNKEHIVSYNKSSSDISSTNKTINIKEIINVLSDVIKIPEREISTYEDFYFLYDHSFNIKGKGTIFTGTVIKGKIKINCNVNILSLNEIGKVKEIQSFKKKVHEGKKGSRLSLLILNNSIKNLKKNERGVIVYETSNISYFSMFICKVKQVEFYKKNINNSEHLICIIGFSSTECYGYFFKKLKNKNQTNVSKKINYEKNSQQDNVFPSISGGALNSDDKFDKKGNYLLIDRLSYDDDNNKSDHCDDDDNNKSDHCDDIYFLVIMKKRIHCFEKEKCIFLKNDEQINCRICLYGEIIEIIDKNCLYKKDDSFVFNKQPNIYKYEEYKDFKILKEKNKKGYIDKIVDEHTIICKNLFQSSNQVNPYIDKKIYIIKSTNDSKNVNAKNINTTNEYTSNILHTGTIIKPFAKQGKVIVSFDDDISYLKNDFKSYIFLLLYYKDVFSKKNVFL
ncbi:selenocysteine-specific elongation factor selB homologue, putative [Plasmodium sp. gorilla clade G2]|uniref:selenocysteine-specific elongation factor selB homologue, putative n=1 Tax=Plasmodium sp. gorilla clade G2 TaxID=880535 RepID=UPI000D2029D7|nr:selenocysteine-specific elongation factor selB homologue, putative [Plasmodium sp. gorilla clade G2]SOV10254.1 selenocysteine-specific elongation factor selB homologue, putative [Plasmodium sp. gorilla clade G2]